MKKRIIAYSLILFVSIVNLIIEFSTVDAIITEGISYKFDSFNFMYLLFMLPFNAVIYFIAILLVVFAIRENNKHKHLLLLPIYVVMLKMLLLFIYSPGLEYTIRFNYAFLRDYAITFIMFMLALYGLLYHLYKIRNSLPFFTSFDRKVGCESDPS